MALDFVLYRYRPVDYEMKAYPIDEYPAKSKQAAAIMHMIMVRRL